MAYQSSFKAGGLIPANQMKNQNLVEDCPIPHGPHWDTSDGHLCGGEAWRLVVAVAVAALAGPPEPPLPRPGSTAGGAAAGRSCSTR